MDIMQAVGRLNSQLPLKTRQDQLGKELKAVHQAILFSLIHEGRPPSREELLQFLDEEIIEAGIHQLAEADLVVLDAAAKKVVGAYPVTIEQTPHRVIVNGHTIFAMCALDAVSVAPMFNTEVQIESTCQVTQTAISLTMRGNEILNAQPSLDIRVGVRWRMPTGAAAHSMCLEMVFLLNDQIALEWQNGNYESVSLFTLLEAVEFGREFFAPLLK